MDVMLIQRAIEDYYSISDYIEFLRLPCRNCEHFRSCENQCGENIWEDTEWEEDIPEKSLTKSDTGC